MANKSFQDSPIQDWKINEVILWVSKFQWKPQKLKKLEDIINEKEISGYDLSLCDNDIYSLWDTFGYLIDKETAADLLEKVESVKVTYTQRIMNKSQNNENNVTYNTEVNHEVNVDEKQTDDHDTFDSIFAYQTNKIERWTHIDVQDWITSLTSKLGEENVNKIMNIIGTDIYINGLFLIKQFKNAQTISDDYNIDIELSDQLYQCLQEIKSSKSKNKQATSADDTKTENKWKYEQPQNWTCYELQQWVKGLYIHPDLRKKVLEAINKHNINGEQFNQCKNGKKLIKLLQNNKLAQSLGNSLKKKWKEAIKLYPIKNNKPKTQDVKQWTCIELQDWIKALNLGYSEQKQILKDIEQNQINGGDLSKLECVDDICDIFEIDQQLAKKLFDKLQCAKRYNASNNMFSNKKKKKKSAKSQKVTNPNPGVIGMKNKRMTCYINCVIQALLQTKPLVHLLRTSSTSQPIIQHTSKAWFSSESVTYQGSMLDAFIVMANEATISDSKKHIITPKSVLYHLRNIDSKFKEGEQGDALAVLSKILELIDNELITIAINKTDNKFDFTQSGMWYQNNVFDEKTENTKIDEYSLLYNPYESIIRSSMHFIERNIYSCLNCNHKQSRYEFKEKVLLPMKDHSINVDVTIYIPSLNKVTNAIYASKSFSVLDYCTIDTLRYQIYQIRHELNEKHQDKFRLNDVTQIKIGIIEPRMDKHINEWIRFLDSSEKCESFRRNRISIIAVIGDEETDLHSIMIKEFNVFIDENGKCDSNRSHLSFDRKATGTHSCSLYQHRKGQNMWEFVYFHDRIIMQDESTFTIDADHNTIIRLFIHNNQTPLTSYDLSKIDPVLRFLTDQHGANWNKCVVELRRALDHSEKNKVVYYETKDVNDVNKAANLYSIAITQYEAMKCNKKFAINSAYKVFKSDNKYRNCKVDLEDIEELFKVYSNDEVLDRGATLQCKCDCKIFKKETKIVRYPEILIFAIDRYDNGDRYNEEVDYDPGFCPPNTNIVYDLYAICNHHSDGLEYGHYTSFVKGADDNVWYLADDEKVSKKSPRDVMYSNDEAIILMYQKREENQT